MDGMTLDVLENLQEQAVKAAGASGKIQMMDAPLLGPGKCLIVNGSGSYEIKDRETPRNHQLGNVQAVIDWVNYAQETLNATPVVWVNAKSIRVALDDTDNKIPKPVIVYELKPTAEYSLLLKLAETPRSYEQKDFIRLLRNELWDTLDQTASERDRAVTKREALIKSLRSLNFSAGMSGKSSTGGGRESLGMDIESEVRSEVGELPEELILQVRLFQDNALQARQKITADLEINIGTKPTFCLTPIKSDLDEALEDEVEDLFKFLLDKLPDVSVFRGVYAP